MKHRITLTFLLLVVTIGAASADVFLTGYWPFTQGSGNDASGNGRNATLSNTTLANDRDGVASNALHFNGATSAAEILPAFAMTNQQTVTAWIKPTATGQEYPVIEKAIPGYGGEVDFWMFLLPNGRAWWAAVTDDGVTGIFAAATSTTVIPLNQWTFIVGVIDKEANQVRIYVNGVLEGTDSMGGRNVRNNNRPMRIGRQIGNTATRSFQGVIDDVQVYGRTLEQSEIAELMTNGGIATAPVYGDGRHGDYTMTTSMTIEQLYQAVRLPTDPAQYNPAFQTAVPQFRNFTIANNAVLTSAVWDGTRGGAVFLKVQASLVVSANAAISVNGLGYQTGSGVGGNGPALYNNGTGQYDYRGGGGGGFGTAGSPGGNEYAPGGNGGGTYGDALLGVTFLGSGGGLSGANDMGGRGGGNITLSAARIEVSGTLSANGANGNYGVGGGGGGSGGAIRIHSISAVLGTNRINASGGIGGRQLPNGTVSTFGGGGGGGRIRVEASSNIPFSTSPGASLAIDAAADLDGDGVPDLIEVGSGSPPDSDADGVFDYLDPDSDNDGIPDSVERGTDGNQPVDSDGDGLRDYVDTDSDNDGVLDAIERGPDGTHPKDTDGDSMPDYVDSDSDNNGIPDSFELGPDGSKHTADSDHDKIPDYWEVFYGMNPNNPLDANTYPAGDQFTFLQKYYLDLKGSTPDSDGDGVSDYTEYTVFGSQPRNQNSDGDGMPDSWEIANGLNPLVNDSAGDADGDGLTNAQEYNGGVNITNPRNRDSDGDGFSDYEEANGMKLTAHSYDRNDRLISSSFDNGAWESWRYDGNGNIRAHALRTAHDADGDSLPDVWEFTQGLAINNGLGTQGLTGDADGDGWTNYQEFLAGTNPNDSASHPPAGGVPGAVWFNPPKARIILPPTTGGGLAHVSLKLWDAEGNPAQTTLQWFDSATQQWKPATVTRVDGAVFVPGSALITTPGGTAHDLLWNALADLGSFNGTALLRATAQDAAGTTVSEIVPFSVNTTGDFDGDGLPDWWEIPMALDPNDATGLNGATADLDGDGLTSFAEFLFALNPHAVDSVSVWSISTETNPADGKPYLHFTYRRRITPGTLIYEIQTSTDLATWTTNGADLEPLTPTVPTGDGVTERATVRIWPALGTIGVPNKYVRVRGRLP